MYETKRQSPLSRRRFIKRLLRHLAGVLSLLGFSLAIGMAGYGYFEHLSMIDSFINSAMLLGGMGPVNTPSTFSGKLFAGTYALYAGLIFVVSAALLVTPVAHRILHKFHWEDKS